MNKKPINRVVYAAVIENTPFHIFLGKPIAVQIKNAVPNPAARRRTTINRLRLVDARKFNITPKAVVRRRSKR